jgi:hypothetical protein
MRGKNGMEGAIKPLRNVLADYGQAWAVNRGRLGREQCSVLPPRAPAQWQKDDPIVVGNLVW